MAVGEFILSNAGPIWLHQNEMWEHIGDFQEKGDTEQYGQCPVNEDD